MDITTKQLNDYYHAKVELSRKQVKQSAAEVIPLIYELLTLIHQVDGRFSRNPLCVGSYFQGLKVARPDEFDFSVPLEITGKWQWMSTQGQQYYGFKKITPSYYPQYGYGTSSFVYAEEPIACNHDGSTDTARDDVEVGRSVVPLPPAPVGYMFLNLGTPYNNPAWDTLTFNGHIVPFLVRRQMKKLIEDALPKLGITIRGKVSLMRKMKSPAVTLVVRSDNGFDISIDVAPLIRLRLPFPGHIRWPRPEAKWPSTSKIDQINGIGIAAVAKKDFVWRHCFAEVEKELVSGIDADGGCRKRCHRIMKKLNNDVWFNTTKPVVSSYTLKNLLFWECEKEPETSSWDQSKLCDRFTSILNDLCQKLMKGHIPHYFNPDVNMLKDKDEEEIKIGLEKIFDFMRDPQRYLAV